LARCAGFGGELLSLLRDAFVPVHSAEESIDLDHFVAAVEKLGRAPSTQDPHEEHLKPAVHGVAMTHTPVETIDVVGDDLWDAVLVTRPARCWCIHL
jgi:hypothetical protein